MDNRILIMVKQVELKVQEMDSAKQTEFEKGLDLEFDEHFAFQTAQSKAFASGLISFDEAQTLYIGLGVHHSVSDDGWPKNTSIAQKATFTTACAELMGIS